MDRGAIVSQGWKLLLKNKGLWGASVIILIPQVGLQLILPSNAGIVWALINIGVNALFAAFLNSALICMIINILGQRSNRVVQGLRDGLRWLLPLFMIYFLLTLPSWLVSLLIGEPPSSAASMNGTELLKATAILFLVELPLSLVCSAIMIGAERATILEGYNLSKSFQRGWRLLWSHLGDYWGIGIRLFLIFLVVLVPFSCGAGILEAMFLSSTNQNAIVIKLLTLIIDILLSAFGAVVWTLAYREWQKQEHSEVIVVTEQN